MVKVMKDNGKFNKALSMGRRNNFLKNVKNYT